MYGARTEMDGTNKGRKDVCKAKCFHAKKRQSRDALLGGLKDKMKKKPSAGVKKEECSRCEMHIVYNERLRKQMTSYEYLETKTTNAVGMMHLGECSHGR